MIIRSAVPEDLPEIARAEELSFPEAEAASRETIAGRLAVYPDRFRVAVEDGRIAACVNGMLTNEPDLRDEMYEDASLHDADGCWQMIFSVCTLPDCRGRGYASALLRRLIDDVRRERRRGLVLTCKEHMIGFYAALGFSDEGISGSAHGGAVWHQMRLTL